MTTTEPKKKRGRPPVQKMPEPIDATPEEVADVVMRAPPKTKWRYLDKNGRESDNTGEAVE